MKCTDCEYFHIRQEPLKYGRECWDTGLAECKQYNLIIDFYSHRSLNQLCCIENDNESPYSNLLNKCVYPNLRDWLNDNEYTIKRLQNELKLNTIETLSNKLKGETEWTLSEIEILGKLTGKTWELLFTKESVDDKNDKEIME